MQKNEIKEEFEVEDKVRVLSYSYARRVLKEHGMLEGKSKMVYGIPKDDWISLEKKLLRIKGINGYHCIFLNYSEFSFHSILLRKVGKK